MNYTRVYAALLGLLNLLAFICLVSGLQLLLGLSDAAVRSNPLSHPNAASFIFYSLVVLIIATCTAWGLVNCPRRSSDDGTDKRATSPCCPRTMAIRAALGLPGLALPLAAFAYFLVPDGLGRCVPGLHADVGGYCVCDSRELRRAAGPAPTYAASLPPNTTVAFVGDSGLTGTVSEIYQLMRNEGVSGVVLNGDLDYKQQHDAWIARFEQYLGRDTALFVTVGNHDTMTWRSYQDATASYREKGANASSSPPQQCVGEIGVKEVCTHRGLALLLSGAGSTCGGLQAEHSPFFQQTLAEFDQARVVWPICVFHQNVNKMQLGKKVDMVGWDKYTACLKHGALIVTAHDHQYGRTHGLDRLQGADQIHVRQTVQPYTPPSEAMVLGPGRSFVVVAGTGGGSSESLRSAKSARAADPWWAVTWNQDPKLVKPEATRRLLLPTNPGMPGAFFCRFHVHNNPRLAWCYYKDIQGRVVDSFYVNSTNHN